MTMGLDENESLTGNDGDRTGRRTDMTAYTRSCGPAPGQAARRRFLLTSLAGAAVTASGHAGAQGGGSSDSSTSSGSSSGTSSSTTSAAASFATRPIRVITPYTPGGSTDILARALVPSLSRELGQPIYVESKPGAASILGSDLVAKSAPDGHTLLLTTGAIAILPSLHARLPYPHDSAFSPITILGVAPNVFFVRTDSPIASAADFLAKARARPGQLTYGSSGNGSSTHLTGEMLKVMAKIFVTHIPYRGASAIVTDVIGGQIDLGVSTLPSIMGMITTGRVRPLAVASARRAPALPNVPTFIEAGITGFVADNWYPILAPGATPPAIVAQLYEATRRAAETPAFRQRADAEGLTVTLEVPAAAAKFIRAEEVKWRRVIREQSIKSD